MSQVRVHNFSISLDGFGTGDGITFDAPFGHAGERLHEWMFATRFWRSMVGEAGGTAGVDHAFADRHGPGIGAEIMGRGKFGPQTGPWTDVGTDDEWRGWWGTNPPFHSPVFVLTHHTRPPIEMEGGTVFHFVDASPQEALDLARAAAGDLDVRIGGGPTVVLDFLAGKGIVVSDSVATRDAQGRGITTPSDSTLEIVKLANAIQSAQQSGQITEADSVALSEQLAAQEVVVNPRYGTFDPQTASIALGTPEWIRPVDAAP